MPLYKNVNGVNIQMTPAEEADFEASRTPSLAQAKSDLRARLRRRRQQAEAAGITVGAHPVPTDSEFVARLRSLKEWSDDNTGEAIQVERANGAFVSLTRAQLIAVAKAVAAHMRDCNEVEAAKATAVAALPDLAAVRAYDVDAGWPA